MFSKETKTVTLHSYNDSGLYDGSFEYLWVVGTGLAANTTLIPPLPIKHGFTVLWNGDDWEYKNNKVVLNTTYLLKPLTRKQFKLALLDKGLLDELEDSISNINDTTTKRRIQIEYTESTEFVRTSEVIKTMFTLLNKTEEEINSFWQYALTL